MYVCIYIYMYIYIYLSLYIYINESINTYIHIYIYILDIFNRTYWTYSLDVFIGRIHWMYPLCQLFYELDLYIYIYIYILNLFIGYVCLQAKREAEKLGQVTKMTKTIKPLC